MYSFNTVLNASKNNQDVSKLGKLSPELANSLERSMKQIDDRDLVYIPSVKSTTGWQAIDKETYQAI